MQYKIGAHGVYLNIQLGRNFENNGKQKINFDKKLLRENIK